MIYLDNAATSWPKPPEVLRAVNGVMSRPFGNPGRGGHRASLCAGRVVYACREAAARYLGCAHPEQDSRPLHLYQCANHHGHRSSYDF